ncbi:MAG: tetratricopeptide repeat protein [Elusimicrobiota bacterium]
MRVSPALLAFALLPSAAAAATFPAIVTDFATLDMGALPPVAGTPPQTQIAVTSDLLSRIDQAYLNRHIGRNLEDSNQTLRELLSAQPKNTDLLWRLARGLRAAGARQANRDEKLQTFQEGEALLAAALALKSGDATIHYWLGRTYGAQNVIKRTLGLAKAMRRELEAAIQIDPRLAGAHHYLGVLLHELPGIVGGNDRKAVAELEEAARLTPNEASIYPDLAEAYRGVKDKPRAIETARKTFAIEASDDPGGYDDSVKAARELLQKLGAN